MHADDGAALRQRRVRTHLREEREEREERGGEGGGERLIHRAAGTASKTSGPRQLSEGQVRAAYHYQRAP